MAKGILRQLANVEAAVSREISNHASRGRIASALAGEGFDGGYRKAIADVMLALRGVTPHTDYWRVVEKGGG